MKTRTLILILPLLSALSGCAADTPAAAGDETNPYLGRVLTESGEEAGIRTNARMGEGAAGDVGNN